LKGKRKGSKADFESLALALCSIWAYDIQEDNVQECRANVLRFALEMLLREEDINLLVKDKKILEFVSYFSAALRHHITVKDSLTHMTTGATFLQLPADDRTAEMEKVKKIITKLVYGLKCSNEGYEFLNHVFVRA
jgi:hypothetical protein